MPRLKFGRPAMLVVSVGLLVLGGLARVWHYVLNYSLNHDDAALALNILWRSPWELRQPLEFDQLAPWGFLLGERLVTQAAGPDEWSLRLLPFLCSLLSVPAFWLLAHRVLPRLEATLASGFFSVSQSLVLATAGVKQYSTEILVTILLFLACERLLADRQAAGDVVRAGLSGALALWVSFSSVFVLAAVGVALAFGARDLRALRKHLPVFALWAGSALLWYFAFVEPQLRETRLYGMWEHEFPPENPLLWMGWLNLALQSLGMVSASVRLAPLAAIAVAVSVLLALRGRRPEGLALAATILITLMASVLRRYPFVGRFLLFLAPVALLLCFGEIGRYLREGSNKILRSVALAVTTLALAYAVASLVKNTFVNEPPFDDPRGVFTDIRREAAPDETVYASDAAWPSLLYYRDSVGLGSTDVVRIAHSSGSESTIAPNTSKLWVVYFWPTESGIDRRFIQASGRHGTPIRSLTRKLHTATLWDLQPARPPSP